MLSKKYQPKLLKEIIGQEEVAKKLLFFVINYRKQRKKALLLYGPPGTGKTSLIYALASELGYELVELNSSDFRDKEKINSVLKSASLQKSLYNKGRIILVDEVEGINEHEDRGGWTALNELILESKFPIILTTNDAWQKKLNKIRNKTELLPLQKLAVYHIERILTMISIKEQFRIKQNLLKVIAEKSSGDARAAINDLQSLMVMANEKKEIFELSPELVGGREKNKSIFEVLKVVLKGKTQEAIGILDNAGIEIDEFIMWLDENLPLEYKAQELAKAYDILSKADVLRGRIIRRQHWRSLVYVDLLVSAGICSAKKNKTDKFVSYQRPSRILKFWIEKQGERRENAKVLASMTHCSTKKAYRELPYIQMALKDKPELLLN